MATDRPDPFSPGAPLAPDAPTSIVEVQRVGGTYWQQKKLIEDERRLDKVATKAGAKARAVAAGAIEAGSDKFSVKVAGPAVYKGIDPETGEEVTREYLIAASTDNPLAASDAKILQEAIEMPKAQRPDNAPAHVPERMGPIEKARRDAANQLPSQVQVYIEGEFTIIDIRAKLTAAGADLSQGEFIVAPHQVNQMMMIATWRLKP